MHPSGATYVSLPTDSPSELAEPVKNQIGGDRLAGNNHGNGVPLLAQNGYARVPRHKGVHLYIAAKQSSSWALPPESPFLDIWCAFMLGVLAVDTVTLPVKSALSGLMIQHAEVAFTAMLTTIDSTVYLFYVFDTLLQFILQIPDPQTDRLHRDLSQIAVTYVQGEFLRDLYTLIPWETMFALAGVMISAELSESKTVESSRMQLLIISAGILKISRLVRLKTIDRLAGRWARTIHLSFAQKCILRNTTTMFITIHVMGCIWALVGLFPLKGATSWLMAYWSTDELKNYSTFEVYCAAAYWAIVTTVSVGYGDIVATPGNVGEHVFCIAATYSSAYRWSVIIADTVQLVRDMASQREEYQKTMDTCERIIRLQQLDVDMATKIREYFTKFYEIQREKGTRGLVARMSPMLQREVTSEVYKEWIMGVPWIKMMSKQCLVELILTMENFLYIPKEQIHDLRYTCFVQRGVVLWGGRHLAKGDSFGMDMVLDGPMRRKETGKAYGFAATLGISHHSLLGVLQHFPNDAWKVKKVACMLALRRRVIFLAQKQKKDKVFRNIVDALSADNTDISMQTRHVELGVELRHVVGLLRHDNTKTMEHLERIHTRQDAMENHEALYAVPQIREDIKLLGERMGHMEQRFQGVECRLGGIEAGMAEIIKLLKERRGIFNRQASQAS